MTEAVLLYNPAAGRLRLSQRRLNLLCETLYRKGIRSKLTATSPPGQSAPLLNLEGKQLLIVYGGDGTINQALEEAVRWRVPIAVLPGGTVNVLARELRIPLTLERALEVVVRGKLSRIHLGKANHTYFHLMAGIGPDGFLISQVNKRLKEVFSAASYWITGLTQFRKYPLHPFELNLDGEAYRATFAVIGNARSYGGQLLITPQASVYENCFDVCLFTANRRLRFVNYLLAALRGNHIGYPDVIYRKVRNVQVSGDDSIPVQMDGDVMGHIPMEFSSYNEGVQVVTP